MTTTTADPARTRVLVAEEDPACRAFLADNLTADGYDTVAVDNPRAAGDHIGTGGFDVVIADLNGATLEALVTLREINQIRDDRSSRVPFIMLAREAGDELVRMRAYRRGVDDLIGKPFSYPELRLRVEAALRRARDNGIAPGVCTLGPLEISYPERRVSLRGKPVTLTGREYRLLVELASRPSHVFTKEHLLREVWGYQSMGSTRTLDSHACRLRGKLCADGDRFVVNVWGVGYRLVDSVQAVAA